MDIIEQTRIDKIKKLHSQGNDHFPYRFDRSHTAGEIINQFEILLESNINISMAGRIMFRNKFGKLIFFRALDETDKIQWVISKNEVGDEMFQTIEKLVDIGDICGIKGTPFLTKTGEKSILVKYFVVLGKGTRQLPEKYHGLKDKEIRYRQREIDLIMNRDTFQNFKTRSKCLSFIRNWLEKRGFLEMEIPILQMVYGGGEADPFITHVNAINTDVYMSISPELFLKRLIVGGFSKVFSLSKNFRNEGVDATHYPEFTLLELYEAYSDYNDVMKITEEFFYDLCMYIHGTVEIQYQEKEISFQKPFKRISFSDLLKSNTGLNLDSNIKDVIDFIKSTPECKDIDLTASKEQLLLKILERMIEKTLIQPTFIIDYPKSSSPLCRPHRNNPELIERFELFINGIELANAYSELNDPILQRELLTNQSRLTLGEESLTIDENFIQSIELGFPPTGGLGIGIDRVIMLITNSSSIRDVILFPFMRKENPEPEQIEKDQKEKDEKTKDKPICIPETVLLFREDMYLKEFKAKVMKVKRNLVWLNQTSFYPASGGQEGDVGKLEDIQVVATLYVGNNKKEIIHVLEKQPNFQEGHEVTGVLDWNKRYNIMRLHSASHIMEYFLLKFVVLDRVRTLVNCEKDISEYQISSNEDISIDNITINLQKKINDFITENKPITISEDSKGYRLWKCDQIEEGCAGTHVMNTKEIGQIKLDIQIKNNLLIVETRLASPN